MKKWVGCLIIIWVLGSRFVLAEDVVAPVDLQLNLLSKIVTYDRNFERHGLDVVVGVVYQKRFRTSLEMKDQVLEAAKKIDLKMLNEKPCRLVTIDVESQKLETAVEQDSVDILILTQLRAFDLKDVTSLCREREITSFSLLSKDVHQGVALGVGIKGERPEILINNSAARAEGADFSSNLLKLSTIVTTD